MRDVVSTTTTSQETVDDGLCKTLLDGANENSWEKDNECSVTVPLERLCLDGTCCCCLLEFTTGDNDCSAVPIRRVARRGKKPPPLEETDNHSLVALTNCCRHSFHLECILSWSARENSCPQCKRRFCFIAGYSRHDGCRRLYRRVRHIDQKPVVTTPHPRQSPRPRRSTPQPQRFCFLCSEAQSVESRTDQDAWLFCSGDRGHCTTSCHRRCLPLPEFSTADSCSQRRPWFCPYCIRENRCVDSRRRRIVDCTAFLAAFDLPSVSVLSSLSFASRDDIVQPFLHFYRTMETQLARTAMRRRRPATIRPSARVRSTRTFPDAVTSSTSESQPSSRPSSPSEQSRLACLINNVPVDDMRSPSPPPMRGVPNDFTEYESFERNVLGHSDYGKSVYASRAKDGGCTSGRDFLASLICPFSPNSSDSQESMENPTERWSLAANDSRDPNAVTERCKRVNRVPPRKRRRVASTAEGSFVSCSELLLGMQEFRESGKQPNVLKTSDNDFPHSTDNNARLSRHHPFLSGRHAVPGAYGFLSSSHFPLGREDTVVADQHASSSYNTTLPARDNSPASHCDPSPPRDGSPPSHHGPSPPRHRSPTSSHGLLSSHGSPLSSHSTPLPRRDHPLSSRNNSLPRPDASPANPSARLSARDLSWSATSLPSNSTALLQQATADSPSIDRPTSAVSSLSHVSVRPHHRAPCFWLKPTSSLVAVIKRYLKLYTQEREAFKTVCRRTAETLVYKKRRDLQKFTHPSMVATYWSLHENEIRDQVKREWTLFSNASS